MTIEEEVQALRKEVEEMKAQVVALRGKTTEGIAKFRSLENFIFLDNDALKILYNKYTHRSDTDTDT
jgi:hypothetical protein